MIPAKVLFFNPKAGQTNARTDAKGAAAHYAVRKLLPFVGDVAYLNFVCIIYYIQTVSILIRFVFPDVPFVIPPVITTLSPLFRLKLFFAADSA